MFNSAACLRCLCINYVLMSKSSEVTCSGDRGVTSWYQSTSFRDLGTQAVTKLKLGLWEMIDMPVGQPNASHVVHISLVWIGS